MTDARTVAVVLCAASVVAAIRVVLNGGGRRATTSPVPRLVDAARRLPLPGRVAALAPGAPAPLVQHAGWERHIDTAGLAHAQVAGAVAVVGVSVAPVVAWPPALLVAMVLAVVAWRHPVAALRAHARRRRSRMRRQLPDVLDVLGLCAETGMAVDPALRETVRRLHGPLCVELRHTLADIDLGATRRAAYDDLAARVGLTEMSRLVSALLDADELGAPLALTLRVQAERARDDAARDARRAAAASGPKIQLVVAMLMVPAALVMVLAVMATELGRQIAPVLRGVG